LIATLHQQVGTRLHGFGVKRTGLRHTGVWLQSADSMAWSFQARRQRLRLPGCAHRTCSNCLRYALRWRADLLRDIHRSTSDSAVNAYPVASPVASLNAAPFRRSGRCWLTPDARTDPPTSLRIPRQPDSPRRARTAGALGGAS
jgi:hypothetical protein